MANRPAAGMPKLSKRSKILIAIGVVILVLVIAGSRFVDSYVHWLWYSAAGYGSVYTTILSTRFALFFAVAAFIGGLLWVMLAIAYRARPIFVPVTGGDDPLAKYRAAVSRRVKLFGIGIPVVIGLIAGAAAQGDWQLVQLFFHGGSFGHQDPVFHKDIGFYVFTLPFILWLKNWLFIGVTLAFFTALFAHYLFGGIRFAGRSVQLSFPARAHLATIVGVFLLLKAFAYYLDRYSTLEGEHEKFTGASYTDLHALLPAKLILLVIAVLCAVAFFAGVFLRNLQVPAIALVLMLLSAIIVGAAWPAIMQQFFVQANAKQKESTPIARNIKATRQAYGLTNDNVKTIQYDPAKAHPTASQVRSEQGTLSNIRLLDPNILSPTFTQLGAGNKNFYGFPDKLHIGRYTVNGHTQDYIVAARQINPQGLSPNQQDWINKHLVYTHGDGFVTAPANKLAPGDQGGYPDISVSDLDNPDAGGITVTQPRIYYGNLNNNYAVVGSVPGQPKREYDSNDQRYTYQGSGGVSIGNWFNRLVFAGYFGERNFLFSSAIGDDSKVIFNRAPRDRVHSVAPWLTVDSDPYPAAVNGRIKWIVDAYTTTNNYPSSEKRSLRQATNDSRRSVAQQPDRQISYIRNSVKAVVDAYSGKITLYAVDDSDPMLKAWEGVFPGTIKPVSAAPDNLRKHFRYPEDLFKVQRDLLASYHVTNPKQFYSQQGFWSVPPDPTKGANGSSGGPVGASESAPPQPPYYVLAEGPGQSKPTFQLTSSFTALQRQNLAAWVSVSCAPGSYGQFTVLQLPPDTQTKGPVQIQNQFDSTQKVTENRTLFNNPGVNAKFGNLLTLPVAGKLLYVEPIYIQRKDPNSFPQLAKVLVGWNGRVGFESTLDAALADVLGGGGQPPQQPTQEPSQGKQQGGTQSPPATNQPQQPNPQLDKAVTAIQKALQHLKSAQQAGDFAGIGKAQQELAAAVSSFEKAEQGGAPTSSTPQSQPGG